VYLVSEREDDKAQFLTDVHCVHRKVILELVRREILVLFQLKKSQKKPPPEIKNSGHLKMCFKKIILKHIYVQHFLIDGRASRYSIASC